MLKNQLKEHLNANEFPILCAKPEVSTRESGRDSNSSISEILPEKICSPNMVPGVTQTPVVYAVACECSPDFNSCEILPQHNLLGADAVPTEDSPGEPQKANYKQWLSTTKQNIKKEVIESTNKISTVLDNSVDDTTSMEYSKLHRKCNGNPNRNGSHLQSVVKCDVEYPASDFVKKEYDSDESTDSIHIHIGSRELNFLGAECIQQEIVKSEQNSTENPMSKIIKTENFVKEGSDNIIIKKEIEFMDVQERRNTVQHSLFNEKIICKDDKGIRDFNLGNECIKEEMLEYEQVDSTGNQLPGMVENEIDFEEVPDDIIIKKEIEFVDVHEDKHIVNRCLYDEKKIYNPNKPVIETKIAKTNAQRQKEYRMRKKIQKQLLFPKQKPKTNAQRQQEYRENRKKMQLSEELDLIRKKMNAERAKRYRDKLKLKKQQSQLDSLLSSKEEYFPT